MNAGPPNAWRATAFVPPVDVPPASGGGAWRRPRRDWLQEHREKEEQDRLEVEAILNALQPKVRTEAKKLFRQKLPAFELPDTGIEAFLEMQQHIDRKRRLKQEEDELMEILQFDA